MSSEEYKILLTFDVEDWFQVENFKQYIPFSSWSSYELRVEKNTYRILDLLDEVNVPRSYPISEALNFESPASPTSDLGPLSSGSVKATFFVLGWIAERLPHLVKEIHDRGHEVASHGYAHELCYRQCFRELEEDLQKSKKLLEDIVGARIYGYRAPSFSINNDSLKIIEDSGYLYDSSYNSFGLHSRYGKISLNGNERNGIAHKVSDSFYELPISNLRLLNRQSPIKNQQLVIPWGGGGYLRLIPFPIFIWGIQSILKRGRAYLLYMHPWEIDPDQPRVHDAPRFYKFRHYVNLNKTHSKLTELFTSLSHCSFLTCYQYLEKAPEKQEIETRTGM
jgi:polysaccharide deacetylase family protein (PEP-CTERM system associated)